MSRQLNTFLKAHANRLEIYRRKQNADWLYKFKVISTLQYLDIVKKIEKDSIDASRSENMASILSKGS